MNNPGIPAQPNTDLLRSSLKALDRSGVPEGLAAYIVLVSEYLFRLKTVDEKDTENLLIEIETKLNTILDQRAVYHIVKALEPSIRESIHEEGRKPIPFQTNLRPALIDSNIKQRGFYTLPEKEDTPKKRITLGEMAPKKSGPMPWIAPWVAGCAIKQLLEKNGAKGFNPSFNLVLALHDDGRIEEGDFRRRNNSLQGPALGDFISWYQSRYNLFLRNEELEVTRKPLPWEELILIEWEPKKQIPGFGPALFTHNPDLVYRVLKTYNTTGKVQKQKARGKI